MLERSSSPLVALEAELVVKDCRFVIRIGSPPRRHGRISGHGSVLKGRGEERGRGPGFVLMLGPDHPPPGRGEVLRPKHANGTMLLTPRG